MKEGETLGRKKKEKVVQPAATASKSFQKGTKNLCRRGRRHQKLARQANQAGRDVRLSAARFASLLLVLQIHLHGQLGGGRYGRFFAGTRLLYVFFFRLRKLATCT